MPRFTWNTGFGLALMGLGLTGCYAHHTADEAVEPAELAGDGDSTVVDPCAGVADDDVAGQMACDPDLSKPVNTGSQTGSSAQNGAGGQTGSTGTAANACANPTDAISQLVCQLGGTGATGGLGGLGGTSQTGGGTSQTGGATSAADLIGLLGTLTGGTQGGGTQAGGLDINTLIGLLGTLSGGTQTGTATGGFIGGQGGQNTALFGGAGGTGGTGLFGGGGR